MTDLTTWLLAQIAAEEARARAATPGPWRAGDGTILADGGVPTIVCDIDQPEDAPHIAANDPAATLRRCAAYRAIVEAHGPHDRFDWLCRTCSAGDSCGCLGGPQAPCPTLRALASIYADADGYDPSWAL